MAATRGGQRGAGLVAARPGRPAGRLDPLVRPGGGALPGRRVRADARDGQLRPGQHAAALPGGGGPAAAAAGRQPVGRGRDRAGHRDQADPGRLHRLSAGHPAVPGRRSPPSPPRPPARCSPPRSSPTRPGSSGPRRCGTPTGWASWRSSPTSRCAGWWPGSNPEHPSTLAWLALVLVTLAVWAWRCRAAVAAGDEATGLALTGALMCLVSPVTWVHHLVWLIPALILLVDNAVAAPAGGLRRRALLALAVVGYVLLCSRIVWAWEKDFTGDHRLPGQQHLRLDQPRAAGAAADPYLGRPGRRPARLRPGGAHRPGWGGAARRPARCRGAAGRVSRGADRCSAVRRGGPGVRRRPAAPGSGTAHRRLTGRPARRTGGRGRCRPAPTPGTPASRCAASPSRAAANRARAVPSPQCAGST